MTRVKLIKIILVMGITGAGKSYLIKEISGQDVKVGHGLNACTQTIQPITCEISGQSVTILDTPGFDDKHRTDTVILTEVANYLATLYTNGYRVCGIIYLQNIVDIRMRGSSYKNLLMFGKLCGQGALRNVVMLTNRWNSIDEDEATRREDELKNDFWAMYLTAGCTVDRYRTRDDLVRIFDTFLHTPPTVLEIQDEMVEKGKLLSETAAGEAVNIELIKQEKAHKAELAAIAADYNNQTEKMKAQMDKQRLKAEQALRELVADKIMLMDEQRRKEEAARAGMEEQFKKAALEREQMEANFAQEMNRANEEKNAIAREKAELEAIQRRAEEESRMNTQQRGSCTIL